MRTIVLFGILMVMVSFARAQEVLTGLQFNEAIRYHLEEENQADADKKSVATTGALELPFFDDFSHYTLYPDQTLWDGKSAFVNKDFPLYPTNSGAATLDAIDEKGAVYRDATWIPFLADELKSRPIRLDSVFSPVIRKLTPADSVYLSFFYQPQGVGDEPEIGDSLILEFARRGDSVFSHIDSITVPTFYYLDDVNDTIKPLDTL